jgi:hypothetical protein
MDVEMMTVTVPRWISSYLMWCWRPRLSPVLRCLGIELYKGLFTEVGRVDLAEVVAPNMGSHTGGICLYHCSLKLFRGLPCEAFDLGVLKSHDSSLICPYFSIKV